MYTIPSSLSRNFGTRLSIVDKFFVALILQVCFVEFLVASLFCGIFGCLRVVKEFRGIHLVVLFFLGFFFLVDFLGSFRSSRVSRN